MAKPAIDHAAIRISAPELAVAPMLLAASLHRQRFFSWLRVIVLRARRLIRTLTPFSVFRGDSMAIVAPHNLRRPDAGIQRPFGVRITLKAGDPFRKLLGADWNKTHWYGTAAERDAALAEMSRKHEYSRAGDRPALKFDKVEKLHESRGL
jgi:hypothetical protein